MITEDDILVRKREERDGSYVYQATIAIERSSNVESQTFQDLSAAGILQNFDIEKARAMRAEILSAVYGDIKPIVHELIGLALLNNPGSQRVEELRRQLYDGRFL